MKNKDMAIIIYSCWKNRDMWYIFSALFHKYWADCNYKVILVSDEYHDEGKFHVFDDVVILDDTWAKMIKMAIKKSETKYVMLWMDDYLLCDYVSNNDIQEQIELAKKYNAANLRLCESSLSKVHYKNSKNIGYYKLGEAYSLSTQVGIWNIDFLYKIPDEWSAWDFERVGSMERKLTEQPILISLTYVFPYEEGVRNGKWMVAGEKLCRRNGIKIDTTVRPVMTNYDMAKIYFKGAILDWCPLLVLRIQNLVNKLRRK